MEQFDLKKFRKEKKLTQIDFSKQLGYARSTISNIEAGNQPVTDNLLNQIEKVFGVDMEKYKSYNLKKSEEPANEWKEKYFSLLEDYNACLKEKEAMRKADKSHVVVRNKPVSK